MPETPSLVQADRPGPLLGRDGSVLAWLGGDGGFTGPLPTGYRYAMTLGDSYYGPGPAAPRRAGVVLANVLCVGSWSGSAWSRVYHQGGTAASPRAFFDDAANAGGTRFSAQKPVAAGGKLYVFLVRIRNAGPHFEPVGSCVARVDNPADPPAAWRVAYLTLAASGPERGVPAFGSEAFAYRDRDLVVYGLLPGPLVVACTVPLAALAAAPDGSDVSAAVRYLGADNDWHPGVAGPAASGGPFWWDCEVPTTAGFGVAWTGKVWRVAYTDTRTGGGFPAALTAARGSGPFGPWGERRTAGYFPEMSPDNPLYHPDNVAYAAQQLALAPGPAGSVAVSYTVGSRAAQPAFGADESRQLAGDGVYVVRSAPFRDPFS